MKEVTGNIFKSNVDYICITTNGIISSQGKSIMGAGIAKQALNIYPGIDEELGKVIKRYGNHVFRLRHSNGNPRSGLISFPTKHDWRRNSDLNLIRRSAKELLVIAVASKDMSFGLPKPGCGNGGLDWEEVKPLINFLPDNVYIISN